MKYIFNGWLINLILFLPASLIINVIYTFLKSRLQKRVSFNILFFYLALLITGSFFFSILRTLPGLTLYFLMNDFINLSVVLLLTAYLPIIFSDRFQKLIYRLVALIAGTIIGAGVYLLIALLIGATPD